MTPRAGVKTTPAIETRLLGPPIPSGGPSFFPNPAARFENPGSLYFTLRATHPFPQLVDFAGDGDFRLAQHVGYLRLAQA
jgi:hypothetical protein